MELDTDLAVLSWTFEKFIGRGVEKIELEKARVSVETRQRRGGAIITQLL